MTEVEGGFAEVELVEKIQHDPDEVIRWMESELRIVRGPLTGRPFKVLVWQREALYGLVDNDITAVTLGRANGKTPFNAALGACVLTPGSPLYLDQPQPISVVAYNRDQAKRTFWYVIQYMKPLVLTEDWKQSKPLQRWKEINNEWGRSLEDLETGTVCSVMSSEARALHGDDPALGLLDEPAQWKPNTGPALWAAAMTSLGKHWNARLLIAGTLAPHRTHFFNEMIFDPPPGTHTVCYQAKPKSRSKKDIYAVEELHRANPQAKHWPWLLKRLLTEREGAMKKGGRLQASFMALRLNMAVSEVVETEMLLDADDVAAFLVDVPFPERSGPVMIGIDTGGNKSMCAVAFVWPDTGRMETYAAFPDEPSLEDRGQADSVGDRYTLMLEAKEIRLFKGLKTPVGPFMDWVREMMEGEKVLKVLADTYRQGEIEQDLKDADLDWEIEWRPVGVRKQGFSDVRAFRNEVQEGHLKHKPTLLMESALTDALVVTDEQQNPVLTKKGRSTSRIDVIQAGILAAGAARRHRKPGDDDKSSLQRFYEAAAEEGLIDQVGGVA